MNQYAMVIDLDRCVGCHACSIACRAEWQIPVKEGFRRNWVRRLGPARTSKGLSYTFYPGLCNHCDQPACVDACPADPVKTTFKDGKTGKIVTMEVAATWKDPFNGSVQIDKPRCLGCGACVDACPYGARYVNPDLADDDSEGKADKCTFCMPRVGEGLLPACVQTCIADARIFGLLDDPNSEVAKFLKKGAKRLESENVRIGPNVYYFGSEKDLELLDKLETPQDMPEANARRAMLAEMVKPVFGKMAKIGVIGIAATALLQSQGEKE